MGAITARALTKLDPGYRTRINLLHAEHSEDLMNLVRTGKADVGLVYRADAINSAQFRITDEAPAGRHAPIQFGHAVVWTCRKESLGAAEKFVAFMMSPRVQKLLLKYGFDALGSNEPPTLVSEVVN
jgi:molybdate transport system substrate-binding protein